MLLAQENARLQCQLQIKDQCLEPKIALALLESFDQENGGGRSTPCPTGITAPESGVPSARCQSQHLLPRQETGGSRDNGTPIPSYWHPTPSAIRRRKGSCYESPDKRAVLRLALVEIYHSLLETGQYLCSISAMHRLLGSTVSITLKLTHSTCCGLHKPGNR